MRGKVEPVVAATTPPGITPAHAGKREVQYMLSGKDGDHPRACGEKFTTAHRVGRDWGSPPRMRGKGKCNTCFPAKMGITPAHAGKSLPPRIESAAIGDHPRACGEKFNTYFTRPLSYQSPPRMRGKVMYITPKGHDFRITPAHAGKSRCCRCRRPAGRDHPRACGEKKGVITCYRLAKGSPPRMRGKVTCKVQQRGDLRDHPRACGEKE